jgi:spore coat protein U-like protein
MNFRTYDPVAQLIAAGGGASLPLVGGTLMGNLTMSVPYKIIQCQTPSDPCDVVNLVYLNSLYLPLTGGTMNGVINQPSLPTNPNELTNKAYVDAQLAKTKFISSAKTLINQTMNNLDFVEFGDMTIIQTSNQGLNIEGFNDGSVFTITLEADRPPLLLKLTVSISGLNTPMTIASFFTFNINSSSYTDGPGLTLNNNNLVTVTGTHTYSEILSISPGSTDFAVQLRDITGTSPIDIGVGGGVSFPYRWILFEEI